MWLLAGIPPQNPVPADTTAAEQEEIDIAEEY